MEFLGYVGFLFAVLGTVIHFMWKWANEVKPGEKV